MLTRRLRTSNDDVLAVGLNPTFRNLELPALKRAVERAGGKVIAVAQAKDTFSGDWKIDPKGPLTDEYEVEEFTDVDGVQHRAARKKGKSLVTATVEGRPVSLDLTKDENVRAFAPSLGLPPETTSRVVDLLLSAEPMIRDELGQIAQVFARAERGGRIPSRLLLSGHAFQAEFLIGERNGMLRWRDLQALADLMPTAAGQIEDLHISGCNTGGRWLMDTYRRCFPNLKTIWSYVQTAPIAGGGSDVHQSLWAKATVGDGDTLDRRIARNTRHGQHVAVWQRAGTPGGIYDDGEAELPLRDLEERYRDEWTGVWWRYYQGLATDPTPQQGHLRDLYNSVGRLLRHRGLSREARLEYQAESEQQIRLIYYKKIAPLFAQEYRPVLLDGYAAIGEGTVPDFGRLTRKEAFAEFERFEQKVNGAGLPPEEAGRASLALEKLIGLRDLDPRVIPAGWV